MGKMHRPAPGYCLWGMKTFTAVLEGHHLWRSGWESQRLCRGRDRREAQRSKKSGLRLDWVCAAPCSPFTETPAQRNERHSRLKQALSPLHTDSSAPFSASLTWNTVLNNSDDGEEGECASSAYTTCSRLRLSVYGSRPKPLFLRKDKHPDKIARECCWKTNNMNFFPPRLDFSLCYAARYPQELMCKILASDQRGMYDNAKHLEKIDNSMVKTETPI